MELFKQIRLSSSISFPLKQVDIEPSTFKHLPRRGVKLHDTFFLQSVFRNPGFVSKVFQQVFLES